MEAPDKHPGESPSGGDPGGLCMGGGEGGGGALHIPAPTLALGQSPVPRPPRKRPPPREQEAPLESRCCSALFPARRPRLTGCQAPAAPADPGRPRWAEPGRPGTLVSPQLPCAPRPGSGSGPLAVALCCALSVPPPASAAFQAPGAGLNECSGHHMAKPKSFTIPLYKVCAPAE